MRLWKVIFEYLEEGYIPNIVAASPEDATEGAVMLIEQQGLKAKVLRVEEQTQQKETLN